MKKLQIAFVIMIIAALAAMGIYALTTPPSGVTTQGSWSDNTVLGTGTLHFEGTITNYYNTTVHNVKLELWLFDSNNHLVKTETVDVGDIPANGSESVSIDIQHSSFTGISRVDRHVTWTP